MVEYWARLRDKLEDGEITESDYYKKEIRFPANPIDSDKSYSVSLNLDDDKQLMVQEMIENEEVAEALKDLLPDFSYVKRKRKPKKE